ncbi:hypothetical protein OH76DRAFT_804489 [Lentinus brumalis]|uniref:Uncharacterized protein n=1 Tax=Lentinus brumalis TaxID=2498619 RepID=A0A371D2R5_9APHY|nr:hypothetical protein OH76DRAFT_804489 [Polyporus brumalis]
MLLTRTCVKLYAPSPRYARTPPPKTPLWPVGPEAHWPTSTRRLPPYPDICAPRRWARPRTALLRAGPGRHSVQYPGHYSNALPRPGAGHARAVPTSPSLPVPVPSWLLDSDRCHARNRTGLHGAVRSYGSLRRADSECCDGAGRRRGDEKQRSRDVREQRKGARTGVDSAGIQN